MHIVLVGCGNMGGAMLAGWLAGGLDPAAFTVVDPFLAKAPDGVRLLRAVPDREPPADVVMLGFKPQQLAASAADVAPLVGPGTVLLSVLAGVDIATLARAFPEAGAIVRVMPNLAAALGKSPIVLHGQADAAARQVIAKLAAPLGIAEWLADEGAMDAVTALVGSGPAFVYRLIDTLAQAGAELGLPREQADRMALAMVEGAAALAATSSDSPATLANRVASPGGTTRAGLDVLDAEGRLQALITQTLRAARDRSEAMRAEAIARATAG